MLSVVLVLPNIHHESEIVGGKRYEQAFQWYQTVAALAVDNVGACPGHNLLQSTPTMPVYDIE